MHSSKILVASYRIQLNQLRKIMGYIRRTLDISDKQSRSWESVQLSFRFLTDIKNPSAVSRTHLSSPLLSHFLFPLLLPIS